MTYGVQSELALFRFWARASATWPILVRGPSAVEPNRSSLYFCDSHSSCVSNINVASLAQHNCFFVTVFPWNDFFLGRLARFAPPREKNWGTVHSTPGFVFSHWANTLARGRETARPG